MTVLEYQTRFFTLMRFALDSFDTERERTEKFAPRLRLNFQSMVSLFVCATLIVAVMRVLEIENAHERYHMAKGQWSDL